MIGPVGSQIRETHRSRDGHSRGSEQELVSRLLVAEYALDGRRRLADRGSCFVSGLAGDPTQSVNHPGHPGPQIPHLLYDGTDQVPRILTYCFGRLGAQFTHFRRDLAGLLLQPPSLRVRQMTARAKVRCARG
ncbi:hypothetical protein [Mesorhizobium sp. BHbdii]